MIGYPAAFWSNCNGNKGRSLRTAGIPVGKALLIGTVCDGCGKRVAGAVVSITVYDSIGEVGNVGYVMTNEAGEFTVFLPKRNGLYYRITAYPPLLTEQECKLGITEQEAAVTSE